MLKVTQKLHIQKQSTQVVDFVDYFSRVTTEWVSARANCHGNHPVGGNPPVFNGDRK